MAQRVIFYGNPSLCRPQPHEVMVGVHDDLSKPLDDFVDGAIGTIYLPVRRMLGMRVRMKTDNFEVMVMADVREQDRVQALSRVVGPGYLRERARDEEMAQTYRDMTSADDSLHWPPGQLESRLFRHGVEPAVNAFVATRVQDPLLSNALTRTAQETLQEIERTVRIHGLRPLPLQFRDAATSPDEGEGS